MSLARARPFAVASILLATIGVGCVVINPVGPGQLPLGRSFELRIGTSVVLVGGLRIAFDHVRSDSRCPMNVFCVWAGDAIVGVSLSQGSDGPAARDLHVDASGSAASYLTYSIKLLRLAPSPRTDREIGPSDYVATLEVTAR